jgi:predicted enzyme related to lactoylglutathione lyase
MSHRDEYPSGIPCWVETLQPDPAATMAFYRSVFAWDYAGPGEMPDGGEYFVARVDDRDAAGIGSAPHALEGPARWTTFVSVDDLEETLRKVEAGGGVVRVPPVDADPAGRLAVFTDPQGAELALWQAAERVGAQVLNQPSAWAMSALHTDDRDGALAFYRDVFGWEPEPFGPVICWRRPGYVGGEPSQPVPRDVVAVLMDLGPETATGSQPHWSVDFWIADADAAAQQTESAGGRVVSRPTDIPGFRTTVLEDPAGARFSASQLMLPG